MRKFLLTLAAARYFALGEIPPRLGTEHPGRVPSATFQCRDGRFAHITASDQHWAPLCQALDLSFDLDLSTNEKRVEHRDVVMKAMTDAILRLDRGDLMKKLDDVAYIRFASVYRNFTDIDEFSEVIREISPVA